jgi:LysM repeat protein
MRLLPKSENRRLKLLNDILEREVYGQITDDFQEEFRFVSKAAQKIMGLASLSFYALDIQSAMKNRFGMTVQKMILASGGKFVNTRSLATGKIKAVKAMTELTTKGVYDRGAKSFNMQMIDAFDLIPGRAESEFGKSLTRTVLSDASDFTFLYDFRKWVANEASLELGYAALDYQMIEQKLPNGKTRMIPYSEAFEIGSDKVLKLKAGINPEWGMTQVKHTYVDGETYEDLAKQYNTTVENLKNYNKVDELSEIEPGTEIIISNAKEFKNMRRKLSGLNKKLNGYISTIDNPSLSKNLLYKLFTYSRNYATGMFMRRFQFDTDKDNFFGEVYDWDLDTTSRGYYITALGAIWRLTKDLQNYKGIMKPEEVAAVKQMLFEVAYIILLYAAIAFVFGYEPGDEDRFKKLEAKEDEYGTTGWMSNQILYQLIMIKKENESFIPIPGFGYDDYTEYFGSSTIALGPTLKLYGELALDLRDLIKNSDKAYYKQDVGPYSWQEKGSAKIWNDLAGVFGVKGKNVSPIWAIKKAEQAENLK